MQEYWNGLPFTTPGDLPDPEIKLRSHRSPALAGRFFTTSSTWEAYTHIPFVSMHTHTLLVLFLQKTLINTSSLIFLESGNNIM